MKTHVDTAKKDRHRISTKLRLRLYVNSGTANSRIAQGNLWAALETADDADYELEIVDLKERPEEALNAGIIMTPCLVDRSGNPPAKLVGNLSDTEKLKRFLEL